MRQLLPWKLTLRCALGGVLAGLANLVPGISGGTMLLATGIYPRVIDAIAQVTRLRLRKEHLLLLAVVFGCALAAIVLLAGPVKDLVVGQRWIMYSLFIGLTLGGVPVVWKLIGHATTAVWIGAAGGLAVMVLLVVFQLTQDPATAQHHGWLMMLVAGAVGAAAMILPGISGGYLLLVLGVYVPILAAIAQLRSGLSGFDTQLLFEPLLMVVVPVGLGVLLGVVLVSNALKWLLEKCEKATLGVLLGMLVGAVIGLWPFQQGVEPAVGDMLKGQSVVRQVIGSADDGITQLVYMETERPVKPEEFPTAFFRPSWWQLIVSAMLMVAGFGLTAGLSRLGDRERAAASAAKEGVA